MFTTGSKLLIGSAIFTLFGAIVYGITETEALGIVGLLSAALALGFIAAVNVWARDSNLSAMDTTAVATSEAAAEPVGASIWPMVFAVGGSILVLGLVTDQTIFTIGLIVTLAAGAQWTVQAWSEGASADAALNATVRNRLANPLEYPLLGLVAIGTIAFAFSRVMLWLSKTNTVIAFSILATVIAIVAFFFAFRPSIKRGAISAVMGLGAVTIVASGVAAGVGGERDLHPHETPAYAAASGLCSSPERGEFDENSSQTVSTKAGTYTVTLKADGTLDFDVPGIVGSGEKFTVPRSNANNIVFRNDSDTERRLTYDFRALTEDEMTAAAEELAAEGAAAPAEPVDRLQLCTPLVEPGGAQLLTLSIPEPSFSSTNDDEAFRFFVPGTDATLGVEVP